MADRKRLPGSADWAAAAYWGGTVPEDNDAAFIESGGDTINANMSQVGIDLLSLFVGPGFKGNIDGLRIDVNQTGTGVFTYAGSGARCSIGAGTGGVIAKAVHNPANGMTKLNLTHGAITLLEVVSGLVVIDGGVTVTTLKLMGGDVAALYNSANAFTTIDAIAGTLKLARDWTTLNIEGTAVVDYDGDGDSGLLTGGVVNQRGGRLNWHAGHFGNMVLRGGIFDRSFLKKKAMTMGTLEAWRSSVQVLPQEAMEATIGTVTTIGGGSVKRSSGLVG